MLREANQHKVRDFALGRSRPDLNFAALRKLVTTKGEPIKTNDTRLSGVPAYKFADGEFIAMIVSPIKAGGHKVQTFILTIL